MDGLKWSKMRKYIGLYLSNHISSNDKATEEGTERFYDMKDVCSGVFTLTFQYPTNHPQRKICLFVDVTRWKGRGSVTCSPHGRVVSERARLAWQPLSWQELLTRPRTWLSQSSSGCHIRVASPPATYCHRCAAPGGLRVMGHAVRQPKKARACHLWPPLSPL